MFYSEYLLSFNIYKGPYTRSSSMIRSIFYSSSQLVACSFNCSSFDSIFSDDNINNNLIIFLEKETKLKLLICEKFLGYLGSLHRFNIYKGRRTRGNGSESGKLGEDFNRNSV